MNLSHCRCGWHCRPLFLYLLRRLLVLCYRIEILLYKLCMSGMTNRQHLFSKIFSLNSVFWEFEFLNSTYLKYDLVQVLLHSTFLKTWHNITALILNQFLWTVPFSNTSFLNSFISKFLSKNLNPPPWKNSYGLGYIHHPNQDLHHLSNHLWCSRHYPLLDQLVCHWAP